MPAKPPFIVTLDGPAGVGKTTLARRVAEALSIAYLDTGAMFRTMAYRLGADAASLPEHELHTRLASFVFTLAGSGAHSTLSCNGVVIGDEIRTEAVALMASRLAAVPVVRQCLKEAQQELGEVQSLVVEGRDMGTVVFPAARYKVFLDASPEIRAARRYEQLASKGETPDLAELTEQIRQRDEQDRNRAVAPLRPAEDAHIVDTSHLDIDGVFHAIMGYIASRNGSVA